MYLMLSILKNQQNYIYTIKIYTAYTTFITST